MTVIKSLKGAAIRVSSSSSSNHYSTNPTKRWLFDKKITKFLMQILLCVLIFRQGIVLIQQISSTSSSGSHASSSSSMMVVIPWQPFHSCWGGFEKTVCDTTIQVQSISTSKITLPFLSVDEIIEKDICDILWNSGGTNEFVHIPVCIQNYNINLSIGILAYSDIVQPTTTSSSIPLLTVLSSYFQKRIRLVPSIDDEAVQKFRTNVPNHKVISLKRIDFPSHYRGLIDTKNWIWDRYRDDNYGNMVWRYAASMLLNQATTKVDPNDNWDHPIDISTAQPVDALVIASANTLHITKRPKLRNVIEGMTRRIIARNVPTIVIGIGIQFEFDNSNNPLNNRNMILNLNQTNLKLTYKFQRNFLKEISLRQHTPAIGVRGDMTKAICDNSGITNCISMGCPSLTISRERNLGKLIENNWNRVINKLQNDEPIKIALTFPAYGGSDLAYTAVDFVCTIIEKYLGTTTSTVTIIQQDAADSVRMEKYIEEKWKIMYPTTKLTNNQLIQYKEYVNVESWLIGAREYDLCLSSRIHGSMTFIGSGVPTVGIPTDFRIMELMASMKVPHILPQDLQPLLDIDRNNQQRNNNKNNNKNRNELILAVMQHATNTDFNAFEQNRRNKLHGWKRILEEAGLEMDPTLIGIIHSPL